MTLHSELAPTVPKFIRDPHNYHNHSNDVPYCVLLDDNIGDPDAILSNGSYKPQAATGGIITFPMKLHEMLVKTEEDGLAGIVSWKPHGRAFVIHNAKKFAEEVLPRYFGKAKFLSFQRQLNIYDFTRISGGPDVGAYYHDMFFHGKIFLANFITRRTVKGTRIKASANPEKEPYFYAMSHGGVGSTTLIDPVALEPSLDENSILSSIISQKYVEQTRLMDPSKLPTIERRDTLDGMNPPSNDLEWMPLLLELDEIDTTGTSYGVRVKEGEDYLTGTNDGIKANEIETSLDDLEWTILQDLSLDSDDRNQFFCQQNSAEEEFGKHQSVAKELKSIEKRHPLAAMIPPFYDLEWMSQLETASVLLDEIDTTGPSYSVRTKERVNSFTGTNAHEINTMGPSYMVRTRKREDSFTGVSTTPDEAVWMSLLEIASTVLDEIGTTGPSDGDRTKERVVSFTGSNAHEINTTGPSYTVRTKKRVDSFTGTSTSPDEAVHSFTRKNVYEIDTTGLFYSVSAKEGALDSFTGTYDALEDVEWTSLQDLSLNLDERNQFLCEHNCTEEEFGEQESVAKELKSVTDWVRDFFKEPYHDLLHTRDIRMAPCHQVQKQNNGSNSNWFAMPNIGKQSAQSKGSEIAYSSSNLPGTVWRTGEPWNGKLQPEQSILPDVEKPSAPIAHDDFMNRLFTLAMRMDQSELSRHNADQLLKTSPRCHSLDSALQHSRSNLHQMINNIVKSFKHNCESEQLD